MISKIKLLSSVGLAVLVLMGVFSYLYFSSKSVGSTDIRPHYEITELDVYLDKLKSISAQTNLSLTYLNEISSSLGKDCTAYFSTILVKGSRVEIPAQYSKHTYIFTDEFSVVELELTQVEEIKRGIANNNLIFIKGNSFYIPPTEEVKTLFESTFDVEFTIQTFAELY